MSEEPNRSELFNVFYFIPKDDPFFLEVLLGDLKADPANQCKRILLFAQDKSGPLINGDIENSSDREGFIHYYEGKKLEDERIQYAKFSCAVFEPFVIASPRFKTLMPGIPKGRQALEDWNHVRAENEKLFPDED